MGAEVSFGAQLGACAQAVDPGAGGVGGRGPPVRPAAAVMAVVTWAVTRVSMPVFMRTPAGGVRQWRCAGSRRRRGCAVR